jgi:hypothetical protein
LRGGRRVDGGHGQLHGFFFCGADADAAAQKVHVAKAMAPKERRYLFISGFLEVE